VTRKPQAGNFLPCHLSIAIRAFQIAGGIVLFLVALDIRADAGERGD
jgi:small neutral amino acid transporter SnatA (MarC family)